MLKERALSSPGAPLLRDAQVGRRAATFFRKSPNEREKCAVQSLAVRSLRIPLALINVAMCERGIVAAH